MYTTLKKHLPTTLLTSLLACLLLTPNANAFWGKKATEEVKKAEKPTAVNIAVLLSSPKEEPYNTALLQSLERVKLEKPEGLDLVWTITENVAPADAERVLRSVAESGKYDIIWPHSSSFVAADPALVDDFPETMWVFAGAAHKNKGGNFYHVVTYPHEPAYLAGIIAGMMTKNDTIGAVAGFPFADVSVQVNGFVEGAKSVNKNLKVKMTYIESWYDPTKAKEAALAQIASGADYIYAERFGPFDACKEKGGVCFRSVCGPKRPRARRGSQQRLGLLGPHSEDGCERLVRSRSERHPLQCPQRRHHLLHEGWRRRPRPVSWF